MGVTESYDELLKEFQSILDRTGDLTDKQLWRLRKAFLGAHVDLYNAALLCEKMQRELERKLAFRGDTTAKALCDYEDYIARQEERQQKESPVYF